MLAVNHGKEVEVQPFYAKTTVVSDVALVKGKSLPLKNVAIMNV